MMRRHLPGCVFTVALMLMAKPLLAGDTSPPPMFDGTTATVHFSQTPAGDALRALAAIPGAPKISLPENDLRSPVTLDADARPWLEVFSEVCLQAKCRTGFDPFSGVFKPDEPPHFIGFDRPKAPLPPPQTVAGGVLLRCQDIRFTSSIDYGTPPRRRSSSLISLMLMTEMKANLFSFTGFAGFGDSDTAQSHSGTIQARSNEINFETGTLNGPVPDLNVGVLVATKWVDFQVDDVLNAAGKTVQVDGRSITIASIKPHGSTGYEITGQVSLGDLPADIINHLGNALAPFAIQVTTAGGDGSTQPPFFRGRGATVPFFLDVDIEQAEPKPVMTLRWRLPTQVRPQQIFIRLSGGQS